MRRLEQVWRAGRVALFTLAGWCAALGGAMAAQPNIPGKQPNEQIGSGVWVFAYFVVILGVASGVLFVCRSAGRRDRARPEQYGENKVAPK